MTQILVTGAAKGLGAEICRHLAASGHDLIIHYHHSEKEAIQLSNDCRAQHVSVDILYGDFSGADSLQAFIFQCLKHFPHIKGLVNNVGNYWKGPLFETPANLWYALFQTNFFAPIFLTQALVPSIRQQKGGILNIGVSGLQASRKFTKTTAYAASKSTLLFYTLSLAKELGSDGVRVNMLSPGYMENAVDLKDGKELPLKRPASLAEVRVAAFLFDPKSAYITGQNIDCGWVWALRK